MNETITVGMPVYNEGRFLEKTLQCFIDQDYEHINLILSDNASSDGTEEICQRYAQKYEWIHYHRYEVNKGPTENFRYVLENATGKYFMWASGHDIWAENFVSECVKLLENNEKAIIAFGTSRWIDENDGHFDREYGWSDTRGMGVIERYFTVLWGNMNPFLGVYRLKSLRTCPIINTVGADLIILSRLALMGDFVHVVKTCWCRREFRKEASYSDKLNRYKSSDKGFSLSLIARCFPLARLPFELLRGVVQANIKWVEKLLILLLLIPTFPARYIAGKSR